MAATHPSTPTVLRVSTTLLGRTKLQASSTDPTPPPAIPRPPAVRKPQRPHRARLSDFLR